MKIYGKIFKLRRSFEFKRYLKYKKSHISKNYDVRIVRKKFINKLKDVTIKFRIFKENLKKKKKIKYY